MPAQAGIQSRRVGPAPPFINNIRDVFSSKIKNPCRKFTGKGGYYSSIVDMIKDDL